MRRLVDLSRISEVVRRSAEVATDLDDDDLTIYGGCEECVGDAQAGDACCPDRWLIVNAEGDVFFGDELPEDAMTLFPILEAIRAAQKNVS